jgi:hypothetical protein
MHSARIGAAILFAASFTFGFAGIAAAQSTTTAAQGATQAPKAHRAMLMRLKETLGLSEQQVTQIKPIIKSMHKQVLTVRWNTSLTAAQEKSQIRSIRLNALMQIKPILTADQQQKFKQMIRHARKAARAADAVKP